jgi:hypothetical protein
MRMIEGKAHATGGESGGSVGEGVRRRSLSAFRFRLSGGAGDLQSAARLLSSPLLSLLPLPLSLSLSISLSLPLWAASRGRQPPAPPTRRTLPRKREDAGRGGVLGAPPLDSESSRAAAGRGVPPAGLGVPRQQGGRAGDDPSADPIPSSPAAEAHQTAAPPPRRADTATGTGLAQPPCHRMASRGRGRKAEEPLFFHCLRLQTPRQRTSEQLPLVGHQPRLRMQGKAPTPSPETSPPSPPRARSTNSVAPTCAPHRDPARSAARWALERHLGGGCDRRPAS